jgi:hypothetical protein
MESVRGVASRERHFSTEGRPAVHCLKLRDSITSVSLDMQPADMSDAPTHSYFWTFEHGPGPWQTWHSPSVIAGDDIGAFTRFQAPGVLDTNHLDGIGALRLAMYLPIEAPVGSPGVLNLVDAELEITLRTTDFDARGAELLAWLSAYLPSDQIEFDYPIATTNWAYTGKNLLDGVNSDWTTVTVLVGEYPTDWTYAGINRWPGRQ